MRRTENIGREQGRGDMRRRRATPQPTAEQFIEQHASAVAAIRSAGAGRSAARIQRSRPQKPRWKMAIAAASRTRRHRTIAVIHRAGWRWERRRSRRPGSAGRECTAASRNRRLAARPRHQTRSRSIAAWSSSCWPCQRSGAVATASICSGDEMVNLSSTDRSIRSWPYSIAAVAAWRRIVAIPPMRPPAIVRIRRARSGSVRLDGRRSGKCRSNVASN